MENFEVGEIAIFQNAKYHPFLNGLECLVIEEYRYRKYVDGSPQPGAYCWIVEFADYPIEGGWSAEKGQLKKKRPPQDWTKLCKLDTLPDISKDKIKVNTPQKYTA